MTNRNKHKITRNKLHQKEFRPSIEMVDKEAFSIVSRLIHFEFNFGSSVL